MPTNLTNKEIAKREDAGKPLPSNPELLTTK